MANENDVTILVSAKNLTAEAFDQAKRGLTGVEEHVKATGEAMKDFGRKSTDLGKTMSLWVTGPIVGVVGGLVALATQTANAGDEIAKGARAAGLSTDAYQEMRFALGQLAKISDEQVGTALGTLVQRIGEAANGSKTAIASLEALGYTQEQIASGAISTEDAFGRFTQAMQDAETPAHAMALAGQLVGTRAGRELALALRESGDAVSELREEARRSGIVLSGPALAAAEKYKDAQKLMSLEFKLLSHEIGNAVIPLLTERLIPFIRTTAIPITRDFADRIAGLIRWFGDLSPEIQKTAAIVVGLAAVIGPVIVVAGTLITSLGGVVLAMGAVVPIVTTVGTVIAALGAGPLLAIIATVGAVVLAWRNWDVITEFAKNVYTGVKTWLVDKFAAVVNSIKEKIAAVTGFFGDMYDKVVGRSFVPDMLDGIEAEFGRLDRVMVAPVRAKTADVKGIFSGWLDDLQGTFTEKLTGIFGESGIMKSLIGSGMTAVFGPAGGLIASLAQAGMEKFVGIVKNALGRIGGFFRGLFGKIGGFFGGLFGGGGSSSGAITGTAASVGLGAFGDEGRATLIPMAKGGFGRVTKPTLFLAGEAGPEDVAFSGAGRQFAGGAPSMVHVTLQLQSGRILAEEIVPFFPGALKRLGYRI